MRHVPTAAVLTAALTVLVAASAGPTWLLPAHLWLLGLGVILTITDLTHRRLPNAVLLPGGAGLAVVVAAGAVAQGRGSDLLGSVAAGVGLFAVFLLAAVLSPAGMGMGDVKLAAVLGLMLGPAGLDAVVIAVLVAFVLHAAVSVILLSTRRAGRRSALPFGPPLLAGGAAALGWFDPLLGLLLR